MYLIFFRCGTNFCYLCGSKLPDVNPYSHFSQMNGDCFNLLFEGVEEDEFDFAFDGDNGLDWELDELEEEQPDGDYVLFD